MAEINDTDALEHTSDIHVHFCRKGVIHIYGTWKQLQDEGFVSHTQPMPTRTHADWRLNNCATLLVVRQWVPGTRKNDRKGVRLLDSDWWRISIHHDHYLGPDGEHRATREAAVRNDLERSYLRTPKGQAERHRMINAAVKAHLDTAFQKFKQNLLPQAKRA